MSDSASTRAHCINSHDFAITESTLLIRLGVAILTQESILETHVIVPEESAPGSSSTVTEPRVETKTNSNDKADGQEWVVDEVHLDVKEKLGKRADGVLGRNGVGAIDDLVKGVHDRGMADHDLVTGRSSVPELVSLPNCQYTANPYWDTGNLHLLR